MVGPMVGLTHVAFRELVRSYVPEGLSPLLFTEMLSTRRLPSERLHITHELRCAEPEERFFVPQLLGNEERFVGPSIHKLMIQEPFAFDINMGCPVSHVLKHNWGVRLMGDKAYAAGVVSMCKRVSPRPVSVKLRGGIEGEENLDALDDFTSALEDAGADWLTIHGRTARQGHRGHANWNIVGAIRARRNIPVITNGDIQTADDALRVIREYGTDGAMIGRAATARPWILWQIAEQLGYDRQPPGRAGQKAPQIGVNEGREYFVACLKLLDLLQQYFGHDEEYCIKKFQFFAATGSKWLKFGHSFWSLTTKAKTLVDMRILIEDYAAKAENPIVARVEYY